MISWEKFVEVNQTGLECTTVPRPLCYCSLRMKKLSVSIHRQTAFLDLAPEKTLGHNSAMALEFTTSHLKDSIDLFRYYKRLSERAMEQCRRRSVHGARW